MKTILLIGISLISFSAFSQEKEYPIDIQLRMCLDKKDISTAEMCNCSIQAEASWDKELNKYYQLLMGKLPESAKAQLKESQKAWIVYRDNEFKFMTKYYYEAKEGTMWYLVSHSDQMNFVKDRSLKLKLYFETLED